MKWAILVKPKDRPPVLNQRHEDYPKGFQWVPRALSAFLSEKPPRQLAGTNPKWHHQDIPKAGTWVLSWPLNFALTTKSNDFYRIGFRYDYNDHYYNLDLRLG